MSESVRTRYPGAHPFADDELSTKLFFGRRQEVEALTHQILANRLVVLFSRSGVGKTSLINAGVAGMLRAQGFLPLTVRVNDVERGPFYSIVRGIEEACLNQGVEYVPGSMDSLWRMFKTAQFWFGDVLMTPVLILDQFEELFTLQSPENATRFLDDFSFLARGVRPPASGADPDLGDEPPPIRVLLSLREDFLANLEEVSARVPGIFDKRFRLLPLGREAAIEALQSPAAVEEATLATAVFGIHEDAIEAILELLERRNNRSPGSRARSAIEPFQLQLVCQRIEEIARMAQKGRKQGAVTVRLADLGGRAKLRKILRHFYDSQVAAVPSWSQQRKVRRLCSEFLISPLGRRLRIEQSEILRMTDVTAETLKVLVDRRLLRREHTADGSYYELSHDSLLVAVIGSARTWFLVRAVFLALTVLVLTALALSMVWGAVGVVVEVMAQTRAKWLELAVFIAIFSFFFYLVCGRARRSFRLTRELFRRANAV